MVLLATLLDRRPVIPQVPCEFIRAVQPRSGVPASRSRFGVSHPSVVVTGTPEAPLFWNSVKTRRLPYDEAVKAVLLVMKVRFPGSIVVAGSGTCPEEEKWTGAVELAAEEAPSFI